MTDYAAFAACDPVYFREHAAAYVQSCVETETNFILAIVDCDHETRAAANKMVNLSSKNLGNLWVMERTLESVPDRTAYSTARFNLAASMMLSLENDCPNLLITDIDCFFNKHLPKPSEPVGLFLRESLPGTVGWESEGTRVAAGIVYVESSEIGRDFIARATYMMQTLPRKWFVDQVALHRASQFLDSSQIHAFTETDMDWEFKQDSYMWTGKGDRKYTSPMYVARRRELEERLQCAS